MNWRLKHWVEERRRKPGGNWLVLSITGGLVLAVTAQCAFAAEVAAAHFHKDVEPLLQKYCSDCHADGMKKGNVAFDEFKSDDALLSQHDLWLNVLKNLRAGLMPPAKKPRPSVEEQQRLEQWIKSDAFGLDAKSPDPGRVTVRRLNRVEYRHTIRFSRRTVT